MRVVLDACVLFPPVMREMLLGTAAAGGFEPVWSPRILEEWARATRRLQDGAETAARAEIALMRARWPDAEVAVPEELVAALSLPDPDDRHVLGAAIAGGAHTLVTLNRSDFPGRTLARHGIVLRAPDGFLLELMDDGVDVAGAARAALRRAEAVSGSPATLRPLLKQAGLPRLGKALGAQTDGPPAVMKIS